jgi:ATP-dependent protease ClpP protease subunit
VNKDRAVVIEGVIAGGNILALESTLWKLAEDSRPIDLVISSPGGSVTTGFMFINIMESLKAQGARFRCFVPTYAASMAFQILTHCDERYALSQSFLLWHRVRVMVGGGLFSSGAAITAPLARDLGKDLQAMDDVIWWELTKTMTGVPREELQWHFEHETLHVSLNVHRMDPDFLTVQRAIPGLMETLKDSKVPRNQSMGMESLNEGEIVYIDPTFVATVRKPQ